MEPLASFVPLDTQLPLAQIVLSDTTYLMLLHLPAVYVQLSILNATPATTAQYVQAALLAT